MGELFRVRVEAVAGPLATLHVDHIYGWNWARWLVSSPTQALHFLWDPLRSYIRHDATPPNWRARMRVEAEAFAPFALGRELAERDCTDEAWNRANVGRFISCVSVIDRRHHNEMWNDTNDARWHYPRHIEPDEVETAKATYRIAATDPCWLSHLVPGMEWYSAAYAHDEKVVVDPVWRTPTVLAVARRVNEAGDFSALPVLADALQEAGCDNERLLGHCRGSGPHAGGCWAVDLLLGGWFDPRVIDPSGVSRVDVEFWPGYSDGEINPPPGVGSDSSEDISAVLAALRPAQELDNSYEWARGMIRFTRRGAEPAELLFSPGRDPKQYEFQAAGRAYCVERMACVAAFRRIGVELPLK